MASPLGWFRRNQKGMLVVFGALLMAAFGLGSVMVSLTPKGGKNPELVEKIVKYDGGTFTRGEFQNLRDKHNKAARFVNELMNSAMEAKGAEYRQTAYPLQAIDNSVPERADKEIMTRLLMVEKAKDMGIAVGDDAVNTYLSLIANDDGLSRRELEQFTYELYEGRADFNVINEQLKFDLTAELMDNVSQRGIPMFPTLTEAWEDFRRLNVRRSATVLKFPISEFVDQVPAADPSDLRPLFAEGQYDYPDLTRQKPGFKKRRQVAVSTLTASFNNFMALEEAKITSEQVTARYFELVETKDRMVMEVVPAESPDEPEAKNSDDPPPELTLDGEESPAEGEGDEKMQPAPASNPEKEAPSAEPKKGEAGEESKGGEEESGEGGDGLPQNGPSALIQEEEEKKKADEPAKSETTEPAKATENSLRPQTEPTDDSPAKMQEEESKVGEQESLDGIDVVAPPTTEPVQDLLDSLTNRTETRVRELDEDLANTIKRSLAFMPASRAMDKALINANGDINDYGGDLEIYESTKDGPKDLREPEPEPINLKAIADKYKLNLTKKGLMDQIELEDDALGQTQLIFSDGQFGRPLTLTRIIFGTYYSLKPYIPEIYKEAGSQDSHVVFITEKSDPKVRDFDEAGEVIEKFWAEKQALDLAKAAAKKVADEINSSDSTLVESYSGSAVEVGEFTWHPKDLSSLYPQLVQDINPGPDFLKLAFDLEVGKCGVTHDINRAFAYVIQVTAAESKTEAELQEEFFLELNTNKGISNRLYQLYNEDFREIQQGWRDNIFEERGVKWLAH